MKSAVLALVMAAACNGHSSIVGLGPSQACPNGLEVDTGVDDNDDGVLEADEIDSTYNVCGGADGTNGTDGTNGSDGTNGANGTNGIAGTDALVRLSAAPVDLTCPAGGTLIQVGLDADGDGVLEDGEIQATTTLCNALPTVVLGKIEIHDAVDVARYQLLVDSPGDIEIAAPSLTSITLPSLIQVGSVSVEDSPLLTTLSLPSLTTTRGIDLYTLPAFTNLDVPSWATGELLIDGMASLATLDIPLVTSEWIRIDNDPALATIRMPFLQSAVTFSLGDLPALVDLHELDLGQAQIGGLTMSDLGIPSCDLQTFAAAHTAGALIDPFPENCP